MMMKFNLFFLFVSEGSELDDDAGFESDSGQSSIDSWANVDTSNTNALTK